MGMTVCLDKRAVRLAQPFWYSLPFSHPKPKSLKMHQLFLERGTWKVFSNCCFENGLEIGTAPPITKHMEHSPVSWSRKWRRSQLLRMLQLKTKAETIAFGKCDVVSEHSAFFSSPRGVGAMKGCKSERVLSKRCCCSWDSPGLPPVGRLEQGGEGEAVLTEGSYNRIFTVACHREVQDNFQEISCFWVGQPNTKHKFIA